MKKTFKLTNDHRTFNQLPDDEYYCENPKKRNDGFRICVDEVNRLFPQTKGEETITVTISTVKQKVAGEVEVKFIPASYGLPYISIRGERIQILEQSRDNMGLPAKANDLFYVTVA
jgi:hypothetical protein